ncbi:MAG: hypothetical protein MI861_00205, partial [Pirellulales bacterium]|nr:hypothetical protein [Pirellulales bacterium]
MGKLTCRTPGGSNGISKMPVSDYIPNHNRCPSIQFGFAHGQSPRFGPALALLSFRNRYAAINQH